MTEPGASHESFLRHRGFRDLKLASALCLLSLAAYLLHEPREPPNGGTWLGYTLGVAGTLIIGVLAWFGIRKRRYGGAAGSVKGWLSAHVYFGLSLVTIVTLHTGFQWGWNVHSLAYALMLLVIISGIYGIVVYSRYPRLITANRGQATRTVWLDEIQALGEQALKLADTLGSEVHARVVRSIAHTRIGGSARHQLFAQSRYQESDWSWLQRTLDESLQAPREPAFDPNQQSTVIFMAGQLLAGAGADRNRAGNLKKLLEILARRQQLVTQLNKDIQMHARMQIWLYFHVPLSVALLAALLAHIVSVFLYW